MKNTITFNQLKRLITESTNASIIIKSPYKSVDSLKNELKRKGYDLINVQIWGGRDVQLRGNVSQIVGALEEIWKYSERKIFDTYPELNIKNVLKFDQSAYGQFEHGDNMLQSAMDELYENAENDDPEMIEYKDDFFRYCLDNFWDVIEELCNNDNLDFDQIKINLFEEYNGKNDFYDEETLSSPNEYIYIPDGIKKFFKEEIYNN